MTKSEYDIYIKTLPEDSENAFRYNGIRYFVHNEVEGWKIDKVTEFENGKMSVKDDFETIGTYDTIEEMVNDKILDGKSMNEIFMDLEYAEF